jgi:hypothetical protein
MGTIEKPGYGGTSAKPAPATAPIMEFIPWTNFLRLTDPLSFRKSMLLKASGFGWLAK